MNNFNLHNNLTFLKIEADQMILDLFQFSNVNWNLPSTTKI